ncbi:MAG TPA: collagen-binding domain-containing protein [Phycisphaerales bacterium]|nr:collagen-binding domain-containing protein [Phycisphaerales bacterium]
MIRSSFVVASAAALAVAASAHAGYIADYNLVVLGNHSITSEVEGRTYVGGILSGSGTFATKLTPASSYLTTDTLVVGGSINVSQINLNSGNLLRTGSRVGGVNFNGGGHETVNGSALAALSAVSSELNGASSFLHSMASNSSVTLPTSQPAPATFNAVSGPGGVAVFDISGSLFSNGLVQSISLNTNGATKFVINVSGTSINYNTGSFTGTWLTPAVRANAIWNFYEATSITLDRNFNGAVLAPLAHLTNTTSIDGSVFVGSFTQNGEVHLPNYIGVPAPAAASLFGLGAVAFGRRRRAA